MFINKPIRFLAVDMINTTIPIINSINKIYFFIKKKK